MKRKLLKLLTASLLFITLFMLPLETQAQEITPASSTPSQVSAAIEPRADVIVWQYRTRPDGTLQKRRWNATKGVWVDPAWINVTPIS